MNIETLIRFLLATAVVTIIPGPNIILIMTDSIRFGFKKSVNTVIGVSAGMIPLFTLSLAGISTLLIRHPGLFNTFRLAGAAYLFYLGAAQILDSRKPEDSKIQTLHPKNHFFAQGFLVSVSNPKGFFFASAFFPQFIDSTLPLIPQTMMLCSACLLTATLIGLVYAAFADTLTGLLASGSFRKRISQLSGLILILFGIALFFTHRPEMV